MPYSKGRPQLADGALAPRALGVVLLLLILLLIVLSLLLLTSLLLLLLSILMILILQRIIIVIIIKGNPLFYREVPYPKGKSLILQWGGGSSLQKVA